MTAPYAKWLAVLCGALFLITSCSDDNNSVGPTPAETPVLYVDEPILIDTTAAIPVSAQEVDRLIFDLDSVPMFENGDFDDIHVFYGTPFQVDEENLMYNFRWQGWNILVMSPGPVFGNMSGGFGHMASKMGLPASEFVSDSLRLYIRPWYLPAPGAKENLPLPTHTVRGVQLNDHYSPLYIPNSDHTFFMAMIFDGQTYWLAAGENYTRKIWHLSPSGEILSKIDCPAMFPNDMTLGDSSLWITDAQYGSPDSISWIWRTDYDGVVSSQFSFPNNNIFGITYGDGSLWLSENTRNYHRIFRVDADASCSAGVAVVQDTIDIGKPIKSLTWDGTNLLAASDSLYVISTEGDILDAYAWTVGGDQRISYYDGYLHVFCAGPAGLSLDDRVIVKLKMR
jgi:hypothetical protein